MLLSANIDYDDGDNDDELYDAVDYLVVDTQLIYTIYSLTLCYSNYNCHYYCIYQRPEV
jgi:hypothetical protein